MPANLEGQKPVILARRHFIAAGCAAAGLAIASAADAQSVPLASGELNQPGPEARMLFDRVGI